MPSKRKKTIIASPGVLPTMLQEFHPQLFAQLLQLPGTAPLTHPNVTGGQKIPEMCANKTAESAETPLFCK